jgi:acyl-CoA dehydrogenase
MLTIMDLTHLSWPFFDSVYLEFAQKFDRWVGAELGKFEHDEGGDGKAARQIFELLANSGWLRSTLLMQTAGQQPKIDLRNVSLMREISAFSSAIADVALSEPWLGILPIALHGSPDIQEEILPGYLSGRLLPAFALSEPDAGSDAAAIKT